MYLNILDLKTCTITCFSVYILLLFVFENVTIDIENEKKVLISDAKRNKIKIFHSKIF